MNYRGEELRAHPRIPLILQVEYPDREGYLADATENLSAGGAFVRTERALSVGDRLPLVLSFPNLLEPVEVLGVVAWVRPARDGVPAGLGLMVPEDRPADRAKLTALTELLARQRGARAKVAAGFRVLVVEDNPHVTELYQYTLKKLARTDGVALEVTVATQGFEALELLAREQYHLVITDLYMPVLDGFEFIRRLRADARTRDVPVVAISAGGADAQAQAREAGATLYLRKPVRFVEVLETVRTLLGL